MANPLLKYLKKADKAFSVFAKSSAALPVLGGCVAVVVVAGAAVYLTADEGITQLTDTDVATSGVTQTTTNTTTEDDENYTSTSIDTSLYTDTVLHESEDAGEEYIDNTLFLGDSNTYRYMSYGFADLTNAVGVVGMGVSGIETLECVKFKTYSSYVTIPEALPILQPQRVIFGYGTNNLGGNVDSFIETYEAAIWACYEAYPYFDVIVNAIPPVDVNRTYTNVTMQQIDTFNEALVAMCEENGWKFLNSSEVLKDPDTGFAVTEYTVSDGLHLSLEGCTALFEYIRTHAYETEDTRPQPLAEILERDETPPDLITEDPLKSTTSSSTTTEETISTVDIYFAAATGGYISGDVDQTIEVGATTTQVEAVAEDGYVFVGWSCGYSGLSDEYSAEVTYTAPEDISAFGGVVATAYFAQVASKVTFQITGDTEGATFEKNSAMASEDAISITTTTAAIQTYNDSVVITLALEDGYTAKIASCSSAVKGSSAVLSNGVITVTGVSADTAVKITITAPVVATATPTASPTAAPTATVVPTVTASPTPVPTAVPTTAPTETPAATAEPTAEPTQTPTETPAATAEPTVAPTEVPAATAEPTAVPTAEPTAVPTEVPTEAPTEAPTAEPVATATAQVATTAIATETPTVE